MSAGLDMPTEPIVAAIAALETLSRMRWGEFSPEELGAAQARAQLAAWRLANCMLTAKQAALQEAA